MASRRARPDDLDADALDALERFPPSDEGREDKVAERSVVEQECAQRLAVDRDVAQRFGHDRRHEHGLSRQEVQLAEKARGAVADDLVAGRVKDGHLALTDGDERIRAVADLVQHVADRCRPLLAQPRKRRQLRGRQRGDGGNCHRASLATRCRSASSSTQAAARSRANL
jgi:hypothetical protein